MKILVIGPSDTKSRGGMAVVIHDIRNSKVLNKSYDIDIFPSYIDGNIAVRLLYSIFGYLKFLTLYKKYDLFHIHAASYGSTFRKRLYLRTIKKSGKRVIVHIHGAKYIEFYEKLSNRRKRQVTEFLKAADLVIALSESWKEKFEQIFGLTNCAVLPNGIDTDIYAGAACNVSLHSNEFVLLGRLGERKGAFDLVNAVQIAVKLNPGIRIRMAGDGEVDRVREMVRRNNLEKNIEVSGWIDFEEKIELLKKSAVLVLPSYNEGLPMAVLEGMASGKAIISTTVGAIPEVVKKENGILIEPGDIPALAQALVKCSRDPAMLIKMSENNMQKAVELFSTERMHEQLLKYYGDVLNVCR